MSTPTFLLVDTPDRPAEKTSTRHFLQSTGTSCAAAAISMILGLPEEECRKLAGGKTAFGACEAFRKAGREAFLVNVHAELEDVLPELMIQSFSWALWLHLEFRHTGRRPSGRRSYWVRHHACVLTGGKFFDPGEWQDLDPEALGELHERGVRLVRYVLVAPAA